MLLALAAFRLHGTPAKIASALATAGRRGIIEALEMLGDSDRIEIEREASQLEKSDVSAILFGDPAFPLALIRNGRPIAPVLFVRGNVELLRAKSVGMCGSRNVSDVGIRAARGCGEGVGRLGLCVVSGYAKGVDTETHLASLRVGGCTVIVLAEGIAHFRVKKAFGGTLDPTRTLVISQFPPDQPWRGFGAMARNEIIVGLGSALVVVEAGEKGGTIAAGKSALKAGKPLLVLDYGVSTPAGNVQLLQAGGHAINSVNELSRVLEALSNGGEEWAQAALF